MADSPVELVGPADLPTPLGEFRVYAFRHQDVSGEHAVLTREPLDPAEEAPGVLCRVHSACLTGDAFHSLRCDCGAQFDRALERIDQAASGVLVYLNQEGRGIGLFHKIRAYTLQDEGHDTVQANRELGFPADARTYTAAADVLKRLGVDRVRLMTNNPDKVAALEDQDVRVEERLPLLVEEDEHRRSYLGAKRDRLGHLLPP